MQTKPRTPRQKEQYERILETTREILAEQGYEGMQMRVLAERAGVSPMTIYNRFGNKDDLILRALQDLLNGQAEEAAETGLTGVELRLATAKIQVSQILRTPEYARAMASMLFSASPETPIVKTLLGDQLELLRTEVLQMQKSGELNNSVDLDLLVNSLVVSGWASILLWHKELVTDEEFDHHYTRAGILALAPAMTPETRQRYAKLLQA